MTGLKFRRLGSSDFESVFALRLKALAEAPGAFFTTLAEEKAGGAEPFKRTLADPTGESAIFGALADGAVVGMTGVYRGPREKERHKAHIWGVYLDPAHRGAGAAGKLLDMAVGQARAWGAALACLSVEASGGPARRLYESRGFKTWGREPMAYGTDGKYFDEDHMVLTILP